LHIKASESYKPLASSCRIHRTVHWNWDLLFDCTRYYCANHHPVQSENAKI